MHENEISEKIIGCAIAVHRALGPGLLESAYEECLAEEMKFQGLNFERQKPVPLMYRSVKLDVGYRLDVLVENKVIVELKAQEVVPPIAKSQLLSYLRLLDKRLGLLVNFHVEILTKGITRVVNKL
ncbi:MAG: GxxExxY protein [Ignavibacteria bacterium]|nr:GxxExxY protein [Ignavibacteria bacterium]